MIIDSIETMNESYKIIMENENIAYNYEVLNDIRGKINAEDRNRLMKIVMASREDSGIGVVAANAMTILNYCGESFQDLDLRGVKVVGADLTSAVLMGANLEGSDLR